MTASILIGRITGAHGIRGAVKLKSFASTAADIATYRPLTTQDGRVIEITRLKPARDEFIADLKDVKDRNQAEALAGTDLYVERRHLPAPKQGEFYLADLVGKPVAAGGTVIGTVAGIQNYGAGDLLELDSGDLIPVAFITDAGETVTTDLPEGFLDPADDSQRGQNGRP
ncbi:MAG: 16S rRNA processing protein RimM [Rhizobiales bacterium]|nr:16S rRNA processing protein RimM [Hyphomicrobiales bacterium]